MSCGALCSGWGNPRVGYSMAMANTAPAVAAVLLLTALAHAQSATPRARARALDLGLKVGVLPPGPLDAITDVGGVEVGQTTIIRGDNIRTGVTAVLPHAGNLYRERVPGAIFVGNGFGKLAGSTPGGGDGRYRDTHPVDVYHERTAGGGCGDQLHAGAPGK